MFSKPLVQACSPLSSKPNIIFMSTEYHHMNMSQTFKFIMSQTAHYLHCHPKSTLPLVCVSVSFSCTTINTTTQARNQIAVLDSYLTQHQTHHWSCQFYLLSGFQMLFSLFCWQLPYFRSLSFLPELVYSYLNCASCLQFLPLLFIFFTAAKLIL